MKNIIQILNIVKVAGTSRKTGNQYDMRMAQCVIERNDPETGAPAPLIGELVLPEKFKEALPGRYEVTFEISVDQSKRVGSVVSSMELISPPGRVASPSVVVPPTPKA